MPTSAPSKKTLVQAKVAAATKKKLEKLAKATRRPLASYVAMLLDLHVKKVDVKIVRALHQAWQGIEGKNYPLDLEREGRP